MIDQITSDTTFQEITVRFKRLEKSFIKLKKEIKMKLKEIQMEDAKRKQFLNDVRKNSEYFNDINPLPVEKSKKKKTISAYSIEAAIIISLALIVILFKIIFR